MKVYFKFLAMTLIMGFFLLSCSKDDDPMLKAPVITQFEFGEGSSHSSDPVAYKGSDIHLAADIEAEAIVSSISIDIHAHDLSPGEEEVEWDYEETYADSKYKVRNPEFHEHIDIPANIPAGEYHISLTVTDELGNSTETEGQLQVLDPISINDVSVDSTVTRGDEMDAAFKILAVHGIHSIEVDIHAHDLTPGSGEIEWDYVEDFSEGYHGETEVEFHEHIDVPVTAPVGEYHVLFTIEDEKGNTQKYEIHLEVTSN